MGLMNEMMTKEEWERQQQGLPPRPKKEVVIPEPEPPVIENPIHFEDLDDKEITDVQGHMKSVKNKDGMIFTGFDLFVVFRDKSQISGWLSDCDFQKLKLALRGSKVKTGVDLILG